MAQLLYSFIYRLSRATCAQSQNLLMVPMACARVGDASLSVAGPLLWNKLPNSLKRYDIVDSFKRNLENRPVLDDIWSLIDSFEAGFC